MNDHLQRALVLFDQSRPELAEKELRQALAAEPDSALAHALLALCLSKRDERLDATDEAETAIRLAPDLPFAHYVLADVLHDRGHLPEAEQAVAEAIRLHPEDADHFALLAIIRLDQRNWTTALQAAEQGLSLDAEHVGCNNLRAQALVQLGRRAEAGLTLGTALARNPENAYTHANRGWSLLHEGEPKKAMEHFREALRLDPEMDWARRGIVEALKARNIIYGLMLRFFLWMGRLSYKVQSIIIVGGLIGYHTLKGLLEEWPNLPPWVPVLVTISYVGFVLMTWIADPLFNLILRLDRFGRLVLSREQIVASNWIGLCLVLTLVAAAIWLATDSREAGIATAMLGVLLIPVAATFKCQNGWPRQVMTAYSVGLAISGAITIALFFFDTILWVLPAVVNLLGSWLAPWVANAMMMMRPRR